MTVAVVLFTSDLRLHDHPPLRAALATAEKVVPLFVRDDHAGRFVDAANRQAFLADCLTDLDAGLRARGGYLVHRTGTVVEEVCGIAAHVGASQVHLSAGVSGYAQRREQQLRAALRADGRTLHTHDAVVTALEPGAVTPAGSDHYAVFTPYFRRWSQARPRTPLRAPQAVPVPDGLRTAPLPSRAATTGTCAALPAGGETQGRRRMHAWLRAGVDQYAQLRDDLGRDATSRLSAHLHFGTVSATELVHRVRAHGGAGADAFVRQLCWRDFHHQVLAARPASAQADYHDRDDHWRAGPDVDAQVEAWRTGRTGIPAVDAAMRQLAHEGWMHNRARLLAAGFLTKTLYVDWRVGASHFLDLLVDGDLANNQMNWQWVAGTGTDTRPNRVPNPHTQGRRLDADGRYVCRWIPELAQLERGRRHDPARAAPLYTGGPPIVDLAAGRERFLRARHAAR